MEVFKTSWARWGEYAWYTILISAGVLELIGLRSASVPTLSDLVVALVRRWGWFGRLSAAGACLWLAYHFSIEPFLEFLRGR